MSSKSSHTSGTGRNRCSEELPVKAQTWVARAAGLRRYLREMCTRVHPEDKRRGAHGSAIHSARWPAWSSEPCSSHRRAGQTRDLLPCGTFNSHKHTVGPKRLAEGTDCMLPFIYGSKIRLTATNPPKTKTKNQVTNVQLEIRPVHGERRVGRRRERDLWVLKRSASCFLR